MEEIILEVGLREGQGKGRANALRRQGLIPAVVYGQGKKSQSITLKRTEFLRLIHQRRIETALINVKLKDEDKKVKEHTCVIKEIQYDPTIGDIIHVDFNRISLTKAIKVKVPVVAKGEPIGVKQEAGMLEHILWEIEVECLPKDIPQELEVDVSNLKINDVIQIKDIKVPEGVKVLNDPQAIVLSVVAPVKEEVIVPPEEARLKPEEPEVIKEKKEAPTEEAKEEPKEKDRPKEKGKEAK